MNEHWDFRVRFYVTSSYNHLQCTGIPRGGGGLGVGMDGQWYEPADGISIRMKGFDQRVNETENGVGGGGGSRKG